MYAELPDVGLVNLARAGDKLATNELFERYRGLLWHVTNHFARQFRRVDRDDLFQAAAIGMMTAVRLYDPAKLQKFGSYAFMVCRHAVAKWLSKELNSNRIGAPKICCVEAMDVYPAADETQFQDEVEERQQLVAKALMVVTPLQRELLCRHFGLEGHEPLNCEAIAYQRGQSGSNIRQLIRKAIRTIRRWRTHNE